MRERSRGEKGIGFMRLNGVGLEAQYHSKSKGRAGTPHGLTWSNH
jgi:hypothetical protein